MPNEFGEFGFNRFFPGEWGGRNGRLERMEYKFAMDHDLDNGIGVAHLGPNQAMCVLAKDDPCPTCALAQNEMDVGIIFTGEEGDDGDMEWTPMALLPNLNVVGLQVPWDQVESPGELPPAMRGLLDNAYRDAREDLIKKIDRAVKKK